MGWWCLSNVKRLGYLDIEKVRWGPVFNKNCVSRGVPGQWGPPVNDEKVCVMFLFIPAPRMRRSLQASFCSHETCHWSIPSFMTSHETSHDLANLSFCSWLVVSITPNLRRRRKGHPRKSNHLEYFSKKDGRQSGNLVIKTKQLFSSVLMLEWSFKHFWTNPNWILCYDWEQ